jgi:hypothetical protein
LGHMLRMAMVVVCISSPSNLLAPQSICAAPTYRPSSGRRPLPDSLPTSESAALCASLPPSPLPFALGDSMHYIASTYVMHRINCDTSYRSTMTPHWSSGRRPPPDSQSDLRRTDAGAPGRGRRRRSHRGRRRRRHGGGWRRRRRRRRQAQRDGASGAGGGSTRIGLFEIGEIDGREEGAK